jgi:2-polyprenyl-3-methyl-5-hydroxy-6-metoxy-1,4-benzoquinol methylase
MKVVADLMGHVAERIRGKRVLYIGVGDLQGGVSPNALRMRHLASEFHAIDLDPKLVSENPSLNIILLDLDLPIQIRLPPVDVVVMTEVIEHLRSPVSTLQNLGVLLPGSRLIVSAPNALSFGRIVSALWSPRFYDVFDGLHLMVFNRYTLKRTLAQAGMTEVDMCVYDPIAVMHPFLRWRPDFARGLYFEATFPTVARTSSGNCLP